MALGTIAALCCALLLSVAPAAAQGRVVAVGDVHGNLDGFVQILQQAKLLDAQRNWIGGNATLVQTGDCIDRGKEMRGVLDFLMALEKQAARKGGRVITLLGNHEAMNMYGDLRYVTPENYASFADGNSEKRRAKAWEQYIAWTKKRAQLLNAPVPVLGADAEKAWMDAHPLGYFEHRDAFGPKGVYGKWLREKPAILQIGTTAFLHGGIAPEFATWKVADINKRIQNELLAYDSYRQAYSEQGAILPFFTMEQTLSAMSMILNHHKKEIETKQSEAVAAGKAFTPSAAEKKRIEEMETFLTFPSWLSIHSMGPLWYRGFGTWTDADGPAQLEKLAPLGITHFVVGHTPQLAGAIKVRFDGRIYLIDTGILSSYYKGGVLSALEIDGGKFSAIYTDRRVALHDANAPAPSSAGQKEDDDGLDGESQFGDLGGGERQGSKTATKSKTAQESSENGGEDRPSAPRAIPAPPRIWYDPAGNPLPFKSDEEVMEFLRTATIKSMKDVGAGINNPRKVLLEKDGVQMNAVFREVDQEKDDARLASGRREPFFRDSYVFEIAAYQLAKLTGLDNVPPVVKRRINGANGSLQLWIENAFTEAKRQKDKIRPPDVAQWNRQVQTMHAFDAIVYNTDRNMGNVLIDKNWKLWMIDHTRAFRRYSSLREPEKIVLVNREFYDALRTLSPDTLKAALRDSLRGHEVEGILQRRAKFLEFVQKLIAERGEDVALFTWPK